MYAIRSYYGIVGFRPRATDARWRRGERAGLGVDVLSHRQAVKRVYLHTFGCKANQYDTERVRQALESSGAAVVKSPGQADAAVVNSCAVTGTSEAKMSYNFV